MKLSLIISTYNRAESLLRTLESVAAQTAMPKTWECIVVNNNSTDSTVDDFNSFARLHPGLNIRMVHESAQGLSHARNRGIESSVGEYIAIIDDDETIVPVYVETYISFFDRNIAHVAGGPVIPKYENGRPGWMTRYTEQMIANPIRLGTRIRPFPASMVPAGGNMAFRREIFSLHGGFDPMLGRNGETLTGGEETEMFSRLRAIGERPYYVPGAVIYHHIPQSKLTEDYFRRLSFGVGRSKYVRADIEGNVDALFADERRKRFYTAVLCAWYVLTLRPTKAVWLARMRKGISKGIETQHHSGEKVRLANRVKILS